MIIYRNYGLTIEAKDASIVFERPEPEVKPKYSGHSDFSYNPELAKNVVHSLFDEHRKFHLWRYRWSGDEEKPTILGGPNMYYIFRIDGQIVSPKKFQQAIYEIYGKNWPAFRVFAGIYLPAKPSGRDYKKEYKKRDHEKRLSLFLKTSKLRKEKEDTEKLLQSALRRKKKQLAKKLRNKISLLQQKIKEAYENKKQSNVLVSSI